MAKEFNTDSSPDPMGTKTAPAQDQREKDLATFVESEWTRGRTYVSELNRLHDDLYDMLRGKRPKKNYDWESNLVLNKVFQVVWTTISYVSQRIYKANPVVGVVGFDQRECWKREMLLEKWMEQDKFFITMVLTWLRLLLNGVVFKKKSWLQVLKPAPNGQMFPETDQPHDQVVDNQDVVVDWLLRPGQSVREGRFVTHREMVDLGTLYDSDIDYINLDLLRGTTGKDLEDDEPSSSEAKNSDQLDQPPPSDVYREVEVKERQGIMPVLRDKDGTPRVVLDIDEIYGEDRDKKIERVEMIVTIAKGAGAPVLIREEENPYGEKTWLDAHLFLDPKRWWSMGQIEPMQDMQTAINDNINAMFDEIWANLFPPVMVNKFGQHEWDTFQRAPQQIWEVGGPPSDHVLFGRGSNVTSDAWQKHGILNNEVQLTTSVTPEVEGRGNAETATQGVLNSQFSTAKLDFMIMMFEQTMMIDDAKMTMRFAKQFAHPMTFLAAVGEPVKFKSAIEESFKYQPRLSAVKTDQQEEKVVQENLQLLPAIMAFNNPGSARVANMLLTNILRERGMPIEGELLDPNFFEAQTPGGQAQMMERDIQPGAPSNQAGIPQSLEERSVRGSQITPRGVTLQ